MFSPTSAENWAKSNIYEDPFPKLLLQKEKNGPVPHDLFFLNPANGPGSYLFFSILQMALGVDAV